MGRTGITTTRPKTKSAAQSSRECSADKASLSKSDESRLNKLEARLLIAEKEICETRDVISKLKKKVETDFLELQDLAAAHRTQLDADRKIIVNLVAKLNNGDLNERNSGSRRSPLGRMSEEGATPIDQRPVKGKR